MSQDFDITGFRNTAPYINAHRGRSAVVAFGGEAVADERFSTLVQDFALLNSLGVNLILAHGARPQIEQRLQEQGMALNYVAGKRVTNLEALPFVTQAAGGVRVVIESRLSMGLVNTPMSGMRMRVVSGNYVTARPLGIIDGVDFGHTGAVRKVDSEALQAQLLLGQIPILSPLGYSPSGEVFNLYHDEVATAAAIALKADKLIILLEPEVAARLEAGRQLNLTEARELLNHGENLCAVTQRALEHAINACGSGVARVHLLDRSIDGVLLREMYTRDGVGLMITDDRYEETRTACVDDVGGILELIAPLEKSGVLARRSREQLELEIERFLVIERDGMIIACAALLPFGDEGTGELACLAVHPGYRHFGRAQSLLESVEVKARSLGLVRLLVLTTQSAHWFIERGFERRELEALPVVRRVLYNFQRNSQVYIKSLSI